MAILPETLAAARLYTDAKVRAGTLASLSSYLDGDSRAGVVREAVAAARAIDSVQDRVNLITSMILDKESGDEKAALLKETLEAARSIQNDEARVQALVALSGMVNGDVLADIRKDVSAGLQALESKGDGRLLAVLLAEPALLSDQDRATVLKEALAEAESSVDEGRRADVLITLAPHLRDGKSVAAAEAAALTLADPRRRLDVLLALGDAGDPAARLRQIRRSVIGVFNSFAAQFSKTEVLETFGTRMFTAWSLGAQTVVSIAGHVVDIDQQWRWL
jgi:hypothetical protein